MVLQKCSSCHRTSTVADMNIVFCCSILLASFTCFQLQCKVMFSREIFHGMLGSNRTNLTCFIQCILFVTLCELNVLHCITFLAFPKHNMVDISSTSCVVSCNGIFKFSDILFQAAFEIMCIS
jgi:hypothetical protein